MGLFGINRELQFGVRSHGEPCTSPHTAREGEHFYKGKKEVGRALVNNRPWDFIGRILSRKEDEFFFSPLGSAILAGYESFPSELPTLFN